MTQIEKGSQNVKKFVTLSSVLKHFDQTKLHRQTTEAHGAFQVSSLPAINTGAKKKYKETRTCNHHVHAFTLAKCLAYWGLEPIILLVFLIFIDVKKESIALIIMKCIPSSGFFFKETTLFNKMMLSIIRKQHRLMIVF